MLLIDDKILIIHMRKCGGTSFCLGLIEALPAERLFYLGYTPEGEERSAQYRRQPERLWKHATTRTVLSGMNLVREDLEIYLLSLRPYWERVASFYFHAQRYNAIDPQKYNWVIGMSFSDYLRSPYVNLDRVDEYACDASGYSIVDHFVSSRDLDGTFQRLCAKLGYGKKELPYVNRNPLKESLLGERPLSSLYTPEDWQYLAELFQSETDFLQAQGLSY